MKQFEKILSTYLTNSNNWQNLKQVIQNHTSSGKIFEAFCKYYFLHEPTVKDDYKNVWYFEEIPTEIRQNLNFTNIDYGVDLLLENIDNQFIAVQCKFRSDESLKLSWSKDKITNLFASAAKTQGFIVFTNTTDIDLVSKSQENFSLCSISHLLAIEETTFEAVKQHLEGKPVTKVSKYSPKEHQQAAIDRCTQFFETEERGQLIMPCGSGKTVTSLWIKERLKPKNTLVLVPSLALLRQIKEDWARQKNIKYHYLCVCSETDIDKNEENETDSFVTHTYEIGKVTTNPQRIFDFLQSDCEKVIFSTYQSLSQIEKAIQNTDFQFDFVLCDEAHKTASITKGLFSIIHDNQRIPALKRLYMTATPRVVSDKIKKKLDEGLGYAYDMSNTEIFGYEFYRMSFKEAIEKDILVDYKIITVGITDEQIAEYIKEQRFASNKYTIEDIANNYALETVMQRYRATHAITFHSRVKYATEFSERHKTLFDDTKSFHVSGTQSTNYRNGVMNDFKNSSKAVISNARCLTEGVDVPAIDLVYFCDPKNSKVDIVQATGRALRQDHKKDKKFGYIVIPIYHTKQSEIEKAISKSNFKNLISVIRALCDQDERLQDEINLLAFGKGKKSNFSKLEFISGEVFTEGKIHLLGFEEKLKANLFDQVIEKTSDNWDLWFLRLKEYLNENNNQYPDLEQESSICRWISTQRNAEKNDKLSFRQVEQLDSIKFIWDAQEQSWNIQFKELKKYAEENYFEPETGSKLYIWYSTQKHAIKNDTLSEERKTLILSIQFKGSSIEKKWLKLYDELVKFRIENPNIFPQYNKEGKDQSNNKLGIFCQQMRERYRKNVLSDYWFNKLIEINFNFEGRDDSWLVTCEAVKLYLEENQKLPETGSNLYQWVWRYKKEYDAKKLSENQARKFEELNVDIFFESWEETFNKVAKWVFENNKVPTKNTHKEFNSWLLSQRARYKNKKLSDEQIEKIINIGFDIEGLGKLKNENTWNENFNQLKKFIEENGRYPSLTNENSLYVWVQSQRAAKAGTLRNRNPLSIEREAALNSINFIWIGEGRKGRK